MFSRSGVWIPARSGAVFDLVTDPDRWPDWWSLATVDGAAPLRNPGDRRAGTWVWRGRATPVEWAVTRRLREIVHLQATGGSGVIRAALVAGPWYEGCLFELRVDAPGGRTDAARLRRALVRDTARLVTLLTSRTVAPTPVGNGPVRTPHVLASGAGRTPRAEC